MRKRSTLLLLCLLLASLVILCGCSKEPPADDDTPSHTEAGKPTAPDIGALDEESPEALVTGNGWSISADMRIPVPEVNENGYWNAAMDSNYTELVTFFTEREADGGTLRINGSLLIGRETQLLDLDEEAFWTEEDYEKKLEDPSYVPVITLPTAAEVLEMNLAAMQEPLPRKTLELGEITLELGGGTEVTENGFAGIAALCGCGEAGAYLCFLNITIDTAGCSDTRAQLDAAIALAEEWLASVDIQPSEFISFDAGTEE